MNVTKGRQERPWRIILSGTNGVGKSTWAAAMPKPLFIDLENGTHHLDVERTYTETYPEFLDTVIALCEEKHEYKTLVVDSLDWLETLIHTSVVQDISKKEPNIKEVSDIGYGRGYNHSLRKLNHTLAQFDQVVAKGIGVCLICHTHVVQRQDPLLEDYGCYELKLHHKAAARAKEWCDFLLFANFVRRTASKGEGFKKRTRAVGDNSRVLHTTGSTGFEAKSRRPILNAEGEPELPLDFSAFKEAYQQAFKEKTDAA